MEVLCVFYAPMFIVLVLIYGRAEMSVVLDDSEDFKKNPLYHLHEPGDFSPFYITITICTVFGLALILVNAFFCYCSRHRDYWLNSDTGNRWISPVWTRTPYRQPPLDVSELEAQAAQVRELYAANQKEYLEFTKRESDL